MPARESLSRSEARTLQQRERILKAARSCFVKHGFRTASMAKIAEAAGMSPGLIYRYFDGKNAIILAIIEQQLEDARKDIAALAPDVDLVPLFEQLFTDWQRGDCELMNPALLLEMTAEATRDPQIAQALAAADRVTGSDLNDWLRKMAENEGRTPSSRDIAARSFLLRCLLGGLALRAIREPELDPQVLNDALKLIPHVLL
ncbi:MAG TPA: TetR/AcrR family transcriptional regulator [Woeseiaceae bacterium]|nr:TetR/AcrR family transcriptional regulator [Woeseiaceae bacterium]